MLKRPLYKLFAFALVAASLAACDNVSSPDRITGSPSFDYSWDGGSLTSDTAVAGTVTAVIGRLGGTVRNGEHSLIIPAGAVSENTKFTFALGDGPYIIARLSAVRLSDGVEVSTFAKPMQLRLSYRGLGISDPTRLSIAYMVDDTVDGALQKQTTFIYPDAQLVGTLITHFSSYTMLID